MFIFSVHYFERHLWATILIWRTSLNVPNDSGTQLSLIQFLLPSCHTLSCSLLVSHSGADLEALVREASLACVKEYLFVDPSSFTTSLATSTTAADGTMTASDVNQG